MTLEDQSDSQPKTSIILPQFAQPADSHHESDPPKKPPGLPDSKLTVVTPSAVIPQVKEEEDEVKVSHSVSVISVKVSSSSSSSDSKVPVKSQGSQMKSEEDFLREDEKSLPVVQPLGNREEEEEEDDKEGGKTSVVTTSEASYQEEKKNQSSLRPLGFDVGTQTSADQTPQTNKEEAINPWASGKLSEEGGQTGSGSPDQNLDDEKATSTPSSRLPKAIDERPIEGHKDQKELGRVILRLSQEKKDEEVEEEKEEERSAENLKISSKTLPFEFVASRVEKSSSTTTTTTSTTTTTTSSTTETPDFSKKPLDLIYDLDEEEGILYSEYNVSQEYHEISVGDDRVNDYFDHDEGDELLRVYNRVLEADRAKFSNEVRPRAAVDEKRGLETLAATQDTATLVGVAVGAVLFVIIGLGKLRNFQNPNFATFIHV